MGQPGHAVVEDYLRGRLEELGLEPFRGDSYDLPFAGKDPWRNKPEQFLNFAGLIPGRNRDLAPVLIGAHYDSVIDAPCADDNATSVAVVLGAAAHYREHPPERDLVIALFDSEEPPFFRSDSMGSTRFYRDHCVGKMRFACAIVLDLIGHDTEIPSHPHLTDLVPGLREILFVLGAESHPVLPEVVEQAADRTKGVKIIATLNRYIGDLSDHHAFRLGGEPFLFLSCGWGKYYHHERDDLDWINFTKVERVLNYVIRLVDSLAAQSISGPVPEADPVEFEIRMLKKALGLKFHFLQAFIKPHLIKDRGDLDRLMGLLRTT